MQHWYFNHRIILSTAFVLRLAAVVLILFFPGRAILTDSVEYLTIADNLQHNQTFSTSTEAPYLPDMMRTPLYPVLLYLFNWAGNAGTAILILQLFISFLSCYYVMRLTRKITGSEKAAAIAGWFMALDVLSIVFTGFILTETIFTFLLILFLWHLVVYFENKKIKTLLLASVFLSLAMLCRPIALFLPVWIGICFMLFFRKTISFKHMGIFMIPIVILTGAWITRNYLIFEKPFFTKIGTFNLAWFQASMTKAESENKTIHDARWEIFLNAAAQMKTDPAKNPVHFYENLGTESRNVILNNPGIAIKNMALAEVNLLFRPSNGYIAHLFGITHLPTNSNQKNVYKSVLVQGLFIFQLAFLLLLYLGCLFLFYYRKRLLNKTTLILLGCIFLYFLIPGTGPEMESRFRIPLLPMLAILSAAGWETLKAQRRKKKEE